MRRQTANAQTHPLIALASGCLRLPLAEEREGRLLALRLFFPRPAEVTSQDSRRYRRCAR